MKKRLLLVSFLIIMVLTLTLVSGAYKCSDDSELMRDTEEIDELEKGSVNGLGIAVIEASEHVVLNKIEAELIIEAKKVSLTNETREEEIELSGDEYTVTLVNATDDMAEIKIDGSEEEIEVGEVDDVKGLEVLVVEADLGSLGEISAKVIIGTDITTLSNTEKPSEIITIDEQQYLLEIVAASDMSAVIAVSKCATGEIVGKTEPEEEEEPEENITEETTENETKEETEDEGEGEKTEKGEEKPFYKEILFWIVIISLIIFIVIYIIYKKRSPPYAG